MLYIEKSKQSNLLISVEAIIIFNNKYKMDETILKGYAKNKAWGVRHNRDLLSKLNNEIAMKNN